MKKILTILAVASASLALLSSCDMASLAPSDQFDSPVFDDANAFVAFSSTSATVSEEADNISLPVSLASVAGIEGACTFKIVPDTVVKVNGTDTIKMFPSTVSDTNTVGNITYISCKCYEILTEGGSLKFDKNNRTRNIEVAGVRFPEYTGDLSFRIVLESKSVKLGYAKFCTVTVSDVDHPLTSILGAYEATSSSGAYQNPWTMTIYKDAEDDHKVWIDNIFANSGWAIPTTRVYGNVKEEGGALTSIVIPLGQTVEYTYPYGGEKLPVYVYGCQISGGSLYDIETGSVIATIGQDANLNVTLDFGTETGFMLVIDDLGYAGYAGQGITAIKK